MELSIIIPIYNTECEKLKRCFDSVSAIDGIQFECILVDDGSYDEVGEFCRNYIHDDSRFVYFWKKNSGVSSARNEGMRRAKGKFVCFVDSDDMVVPEAYRTSDLLDPTYDLIFSDLMEVCGDKRTAWNAFDTLGDISYETVIRRTIKDGTLNGPVCKLFKRSFLERGNILFRENMIQGEDAVFLYEVLAQRPVMLYRNVISYIYNHSFSHSNGRFLKDPMRCLQNLTQHYVLAMQSIRAGDFTQQEMNLLLSKRCNDHVKDLLFRAMDCIEYNALSGEIQETICRLISTVENEQYCNINKVSKILARIMKMPKWTLLRIVERLRYCYYKARRMR